MFQKEYCTPHRIRESELDVIISNEVSSLKDKIIQKYEKYDEIVRNWLKEKPKCDLIIQQYNDKISTLKNQIENLIMERIGDREHAEIYNEMIRKREEEIAGFDRKIADIRHYDEVSRKRKEQLKSTAQLLEDILKEPKISDSNLRLLVEKITVHQNEDKSIDVNLEFNGDFEDKVIE